MIQPVLFLLYMSLKVFSASASGYQCKGFGSRSKPLVISYMLLVKSLMPSLMFVFLIETRSTAVKVMFLAKMPMGSDELAIMSALPISINRPKGVIYS